MRHAESMKLRPTEGRPTSDATADYSVRLNLADVVARIERAQAETRKFVAEQSKLMAETLKLRRDRFLTPALALAATLGAIATFAPAIVRAIGGLG